MKKTLAKTLRSALALALALVMVLGTVGTTFAAEVPGGDKMDAAVAKLVDVLKQYGPDAIKLAGDYATSHGYVAAVEETAAELKAEVNAIVASFGIAKADVEAALAGPKAELAALKADLELVKTVVELQKSGALDANVNIEEITPEQLEQIQQSGLLGDIEINLDNLTEEQFQILKELGLSGEVNVDELTDEQIDALKAAGLIREDATREDLEQEELVKVEELQNNLGEAEAKAEALEAKIAELQAILDQIEAEVKRMAEAAAACEDLSAAIVAILKQESVVAAEVAVAKYVESRDALFAALAEVEKPYKVLGGLIVAAGETAVSLADGVAELALFVAEDLAKSAAEYSLQDLGAVINKLGAKLGVTQDMVDLAVGAVENMLADNLKKVEAKIVALKNAVVKAFKNATTADYVVTYGSNLVAIGDDTAAADDSYVDLLNEELGLLVDADKTLTSFDMIQDVVLDAELIAGADLITIGFSTANFASYTADAMLGTSGINWGKYLPAEAIEAVKVALNEVEKYVVAMGAGTATAKALAAAIESITYNALVYAWELPATIAEIRAINEDAVLVVVGLDNPLENCTASYKDLSVGIDKLTDAVMEQTNAYTLAYAMLAGNCTFVAAPNAANDAEGKELTLDNLVATVMGKGLLPNAKGQEYIKDRILNALNVSYDYLMGDANLDGVVDYVDAMIVLQYHVGVDVAGGFIYEPVCDVDGAFGIDYVDAQYILQKHVDVIDKFPVEK